MKAYNTSNISFWNPEYKETIQRHSQAIKEWETKNIDGDLNQHVYDTYGVEQYTPLDDWTIDLPDRLYESDSFDNPFSTGTKVNVDGLEFVTYVELEGVVYLNSKPTDLKPMNNEQFLDYLRGSKDREYKALKIERLKHRLDKLKLNLSELAATIDVIKQEIKDL